MKPLQTPVFAANMDTVCGGKMAQKMSELGGVGIVHRYMPATDTHNLILDWFGKVEGVRTWEDWEPEEFPSLTVAVGSVLNDKARIDVVLEQLNAGLPLHICIDIAHGDSIHMTDTLYYIHQNINNSVHEHPYMGSIIAGNVCTMEGAVRLFDGGADIVKVGVGGGSACTTRIKTGCGFPQLAAISECAKAGPIIADGGIRYYGDAAKALAAGADAIMIGGLLAGTDCTPGWEIDNIGRNMEFRGMASKRAREACGGREVNAEGVSTQVPTQPVGSTQVVVEDLMEGVRSAMSYSGCHTLKEFKIKSKLVPVTLSTIDENKPHIKEK